VKYKIEPVLRRKIGRTAFIDLLLSTHLWKDYNWCLQKDLFMNEVDNDIELDLRIMEIAARFYKYSIKTTKNLKKIHWKNTSNWEEILSINASIPGDPCLSPFTQKNN